jgi:plastocyanin
MSRKQPCRWTRLVFLIPIIAALVTGNSFSNVLAFPPLNAQKVQNTPSNSTKSENGNTVSSPLLTQNKTIFNKKQISVSIARGSDSPSNSKFFVPSVLSISKGDSVIWKNEDSTLHTATSGSPGGINLGAEFDSDYVAAGKTFEHTFNKTGAYDYFCTLHPFMTGEIRVSLP